MAFQEFQFEATDPRGRIVTCTLDRWLFHILDFHPELSGREEDIKKAIERPDFGIIYQDVDRENRDVYYYTPAHERRSFKVVVQFDETNKGEVVTAFRADSRKSGERMIWP